MPDDRTIGELARQIEGMRRDQAQQTEALRNQVARLVTIEYLSLVEGRIGDRITDLVKDIAEEKAERIRAIDGESAAREKADTRQSTFMRWVVTTVVAGAAVIVTLLANILGAG